MRTLTKLDREASINLRVAAAFGLPAVLPRRPDVTVEDCYQALVNNYAERLAVVR